LIGVCSLAPGAALCHPFVVFPKALAHAVLLAQQSRMGEHRDILLRLIRAALANGKADATELESDLPDPRTLDPVEKAAWIELYFWSEDAHLRTSDLRWERWGTERLRHLLACLQMRFRDYRV
jgi:hypothetical protein